MLWLRGYFALFALCVIAPAAHAYVGYRCDPQNPPGPNELPNPNLGLIEEDGAEGCPSGMARIDNFCVDRFEATLMLMHSDGSLTYWSPFHNPGDWKVRAVSLRNAVPQGYISGVQAKAACENSGKRLCTDEEWVRACQGPEGNKFPYGKVRYPVGSSKEDPPCNESRATHPALDLFPNDPHPFDHLKNPCISQLPRTVARSASFGKCVTPEGVYDIMGNLHEWTANPAGRFRGGYFMDTHRNGSGCEYVTRAHRPPYWDYSTGFRCCADARP